MIIGGLSVISCWFGDAERPPPEPTPIAFPPFMFGDADDVAEENCGIWICSLTEPAMLVDIIGAIGDSGICGMCTMSLAVIVACITGGGERGEVAGEFTHDPDRE